MRTPTCFLTYVVDSSKIVFHFTCLSTLFQLSFRCPVVIFSLTIEKMEKVEGTKQM